MSQIRHTAGLESVLRWMRAVRADAERNNTDMVHVVNLDTWIGALGAIHDDLGKREAAVIRAEAGLNAPMGNDRLATAYAENMLRDSMRAVERLALQAMKHPDATPQDLRLMKSDARIILDGLEQLTLGVIRPDYNPETDTGA